MSRALVSGSILAALAVLSAPAAAHPPDAGTLETVVAFDPTLFETPENLEVDRRGNVYVSLGFNGEVRKIAPDGTASTVAVFPIGPPLTFCGVFFNAVGSIASDVHGNLYTTVLACDPENRGIWKVHPNGDIEILGTTPLTGLPNGIAYDRGSVYASDTFLSVIAGTGGRPRWGSRRGLDRAPAPRPARPRPPRRQRRADLPPRALRGELRRRQHRRHPHPTRRLGRYPTRPRHPPHGRLRRLRLRRPRRHHCTTAITNTLVRIDPDGTTEVLLTAADGLDIPTAAAFGRRGHGRFALYITNAAFFIDPAVAKPSLMRLHLGVPGAP